VSSNANGSDPSKTNREKSARNLIETEAIIVAYAMSRLDDAFLRRFGYSSWHKAFAGIGARLGVRPASMKNLRDEFDPVHPNTRQGWHKRPLRPNRQRVLGEFCDASDEAVFDVVERLLAGDKEIEESITKPIATAKAAVANVAERLRTGRLAETFFMEHSEAICGVSRKSLLDYRDQACGFDFGVRGKDLLAIEVKGLKLLRGPILFTDNEWNLANRRENNYWLVIVGGLEKKPQATLIKHPAGSLKVKSLIRNVSAISWTANVSIGGGAV
jgi:hypothetical protein